MLCPLPYAHVLLGERFGKWPWDIERAPADRVQYYFKILEAEGETLAALAGVDRSDDPHQVFLFMEED